MTECRQPAHRARLAVIDGRLGDRSCTHGGTLQSSQPLVHAWGDLVALRKGAASGVLPGDPFSVIQL